MKNDTDSKPYSVKLKINDRLIDLKDLVKVCNDHCKDCSKFNQDIVDNSESATNNKKNKKK
jgi:hypothetical protein